MAGYRKKCRFPKSRCICACIMYNMMDPDGSQGERSGNRHYIYIFIVYYLYLHLSFLFLFFRFSHNRGLFSQRFRSNRPERYRTKLIPGTQSFTTTVEHTAFLDSDPGHGNIPVRAPFSRICNVSLIVKGPSANRIYPLYGIRRLRNRYILRGV